MRVIVCVCVCVCVRVRMHKADSEAERKHEREKQTKEGEEVGVITRYFQICILTTCSHWIQDNVYEL